MNFHDLHTTIMSVSADAVEFAVNWLMQSTLLIAGGLLLARYLRQHGSAAQSLIYRTTLVAVLICPIATWGLGRMGVSGWSVVLAPAYQMNRIDPTEIESSQDANSSSEQAPVVGPELGEVRNALSDEGQGTSLVARQSPIVPETAETALNAGLTPPSVPVSPNETAVTSTVASEMWQLEISWLGLLAPFALLAWLVVGGCLLARLASSWWRMSSLVGGAHRADESTTELCHALANELSVSVPVVLRSPFIPSPCLAGIGLVQPANILLPNDDLDLPMRDVLVHELAHLRRHDCHWNLVRQIATAIYCFQPLMWVLSRRIEITAEEVCDDIVVSTGGDRHDYAHRLVDIAELSADVSAAAVAAAGVGIVSLRSMLARRVDRILDTSRSLSTRVGHLLMIAVLIGGVTGTAIVGLVGLNQPAVVADQEEGDAKANSQSELADSVHFAGKVVDPSGNPVAGASIFVTFYVPDATGLFEDNWKPLAKSKADGSFSFRFDRSEHGGGVSSYEAKFSTLVAVKDGFGLASGNGQKFTGGEQSESEATLKLIEDHPVKGRITDINGQPVAGAKLTLFRLYYNDENDLSDWNAEAKKPRADFYSTREHTALILGGTPVRSFVKPGRTNGKGEFEISGIGRGRIARLTLEGPDIETQKLEVRTEDGETISLFQESRSPELGTLTYYPAQFEHVAGPSVPVAGVVRDKATGEPIAGATIKSQFLHGQRISGWGQDFIRAVTDAEGKYLLTGLPLGSENRIAAIVPDGEVAYLSQSLPARTATSTGDASPVEVNFDMPAGVWITGQITDAATGKGLAGRIAYFSASENPGSALLRHGVDERDRLTTDDAGNFRIAGLQGKGYLAFTAHAHEDYPRAVGITNVDKSVKTTPGMIDARPSMLIAANYHLIAEIAPEEEATEYSVNFTLDSGTTRTGTVVDNAGNEVDDYFFYGQTPEFSRWASVKQKQFMLKAYRANASRRVFVASPQRNLAGFSLVSGDPSESLVIQVGPAGSVRGRLVGEDGDPLANRPLVSWSAPIARPADTAKPSVFQPPLFVKTQQNHELTTDAEGRFAFNCLLPNTEYRLLAKPSDDAYYTPIDMVIRAAAGETQELGDVRLSDDPAGFNKAAKEALLQAATKLEQPQKPEGNSNKAVGKPGNAAANTATVQVLLPNGRAAASTHVAVTGFDPERGEMQILAEAMTDSDGSCQLDAKIMPADSSPQNMRFLIARRDGYGIGWKTLGGPTTPGLDERSSLKVQLHEEGIVKGKLIDIEGQPAAGELLQITMIMDPAAGPRGFDSMVGFRGKPDAKRPAAWVASATSDASGKFELSGVPQGYGLSMSIANSKKFAPQDISINTGQPEQRGERDATYRPVVKNIKPGEEAVIALNPAKVFIGTVTYEDSDEPVPGAKVSIWASQQAYGSMVAVEGHTDADGRYRILPHPGIRFGVTAYPPSGVPYMARKTERIAWENSDLEREVNIRVPRVALVRGRVLEEGTDKPVEAATITFESGGNQSDMPKNVVTGWQAKQTTDVDGNFTFAVPHGRGTLLVKKKDANYILQHELSRQIRSGKPGGSRVYAHALHEVNTSEGDNAVDVEIRVKPGRVVSGKIVDEQGKPIKDTRVVTNLDVWDYSGNWRGSSGPTLGGTFQLKGLTADQPHPVFFLDPHQKLGATVNLRATDDPVSVVLQPCGVAKAKFVLDSEDRQFSPTLYIVVTPGAGKYDLEALSEGKTVADSDFVANVDRINYGRQQPKRDAEGYYTFPALIPGATYRLHTQEDSRWSYKDFTVQSGETLDLGEFTPKFDD